MHCTAMTVAFVLGAKREATDVALFCPSFLVNGFDMHPDVAVLREVLVAYVTWKASDAVVNRRQVPSHLVFSFEGR